MIYMKNFFKEYMASISSILDSGNQDVETIQADLLKIARISQKDLVIFTINNLALLKKF